MVDVLTGIKENMQFVRQIFRRKLSNLQVIELQDFLKDSHFKENSFPSGVHEKVNNLLLFD